MPMINTDHLHFEPTDSDWVCPDCGWKWSHKAGALRISHPFAAPILLSLITEYLNRPDYRTPDSITRDMPFDDEDSFSWAVQQLIEIETALTPRKVVVKV